MSQGAYILTLDSPLDELQEWPGNPKAHDLGAIRESMERNGARGVLVAQAGTKRVLAGHGRLEVLRGLGFTRWPVMFLDVDDATAQRIVLADNQLTLRGGADATALTELLKAARDSGLVGTGYDEEDLEQLLRAAGAAQATFGEDPRERLETFNRTDVRQIVLVMGGEEYGPRMAQLEAVRTASGQTSLAGAVLWLLDQWEAEYDAGD